MSSPTRAPDLMPVKELVERLGLSEHKVQEMQRQNELPFRTIRIGGRVMFSRRAYDDWLSQYDYLGEQSEEREHDGSPAD